MITYASLQFAGSMLLPPGLPLADLPAILNGSVYDAAQRIWVKVLVEPKDFYAKEN